MPLPISFGGIAGRAVGKQNEGYTFGHYALIKVFPACIIADGDCYVAAISMAHRLESALFLSAYCQTSIFPI
jgi:hypothetical protein